MHDWTYENRAIYYTELTKIGANVGLADPHRVYVTGPTKWSRADLVCPPALRPASLLLIGMLAAEGVYPAQHLHDSARLRGSRRAAELAWRARDSYARNLIYFGLAERCATACVMCLGKLLRAFLVIGLIGR